VQKYLIKKVLLSTPPALNLRREAVPPRGIASLHSQEYSNEGVFNYRLKLFCVIGLIKCNKMKGLEEEK
jgi:hypothetical protein